MKDLTFYGTDISNEISLLEYGLLVSNEASEDGDNTHFVVYRQGENFGTGHISEEDIDSLLTGKEWANEDELHNFYSFIGEVEREDYLKSDLCRKLSDAIQYWGIDNVIGTDYYPMNEAEAIERYLNA